MSKYDVISNFGSLIFPLVPSKMKFFRNFCVSLPIKLKFDTGTQNWMLIHIADSKSGFRDNFEQYDEKNYYFMSMFGQMPLRNCAAMATPKIPGDQKLFERCVIC